VVCSYLFWDESAPRLVLDGRMRRRFAFGFRRMGLLRHLRAPSVTNLCGVWLDARTPPPAQLCLSIDNLPRGFLSRPAGIPQERPSRNCPRPCRSKDVVHRFAPFLIHIYLSFQGVNCSLVQWPSFIDAPSEPESPQNRFRCSSRPREGAEPGHARSLFVWPCPLGPR
jgi:hypothetical protein